MANKLYKWSTYCLLALLLVSGAAVAQSPGSFSRLTVTGTTGTDLLVGCAVGTTSGCTGGMVAGTGKFTTAIATDGAALPTHGIAIPDATPSSTSFVLYNCGGSLCWNGIVLATGSSLSGTTGTIPIFTASNAVGDSTIVKSGTTYTATGTWNATVAYQLGGVSINTGGTLTNVGYLDQANYWTNTSGNRFKAGISVDDAVPSTHGITMPSAVPGSLINALYNESGVLKWPQGGALIGGGLTAGSGGVAIIDSTGKIPALTSTYLASLDGSALTGISASTITTADDTTTNSTMYPVWATAVGAGISPKVSTTKLTFNPSTATLTTTTFVGTTFTGTLNGAAPAGSLTGATLAAGVTASSLTSLGTLSSLSVSSGAATAISSNADANQYLLRLLRAGTEKWGVTIDTSDNLNFRLVGVGDRWQIRNNGFLWQSGAESAGTDIGGVGNPYTLLGSGFGNTFMLYGNQSDGVSIMAGGGTAGIKFYTAGVATTDKRAELTAGGVWKGRTLSVSTSDVAFFTGVTSGGILIISYGTDGSSDYLCRIMNITANNGVQSSISSLAGGSAVSPTITVTSGTVYIKLASGTYNVTATFIGS